MQVHDWKSMKDTVQEMYYKESKNYNNNNNNHIVEVNDYKKSSAK